MKRSWTSTPTGWALCICLLSALLGAALPSKTSAQEAGESDSYREVITEAVKEFKLGHWPEATALFKRAHAIKPSAKTARGLGIVYFESRDYTLAVKYLQDAVQNADGVLSETQAKDAREILDRALQFTATVTVAVTPEDASVSIDGAPVQAQTAVRLNAGNHSLVVSRDGYRTVERPLRVEGGSDQQLQIRLPQVAGLQASAGAPEAARDGSGSSVLQPLAWVSGGLAVAAGLTGIVLWRVDQDGPVSNYSAASCGDANLAGPKCDDYRSEHQSLQTAAQVSGVLAGVFAVTSATLFIVSLTTDDGDEQAFRCAPGLGAVACGGHF